jgi:hypothetical protein
MKKKLFKKNELTKLTNYPQYKIWIKKINLKKTT